jgi:cytochrome c oxidase subunit 3
MSEHTKTLEEYKAATINNRMGLWLFLFSDTFVFAGLFITRFNLMPDTRPDLDQFLGLVVTVILLFSSFFMNRAEIEMGVGNVKGFLRNTMLTMILGGVFLLGVVLVEWPAAAAHNPLTEGVAGVIFFTMTGFHAIHVLTGLIFLWIVYRNGQRGLYSKERHYAVEAAAIYWHFVDVVWIFFYPALYLIGKLPIG